MSSSLLPVFRFDGTHVHDWIFVISHFFIQQQTPEDQRLAIASSYLDGAALAWYQWMDRNHQITSWTEFLWKLEIRFPSVHGVAYSLPSTPPILTSDLEFNSNATTNTALESLIIVDPDSDDLVSEGCDSSSQPSDSYSDFASDLLAEMMAKSDSADDASSASMEDVVSDSVDFDSVDIPTVRMEQTPSLIGIPFLEPVPAIIDEPMNMEPLSILKEEQSCLLSPKPSTLQTETTGAEYSHPFDASLTHIYPYDPGPILSQSLNSVCYPPYSSQLVPEGLTGTPSYAVQAFDSQFTSMVLQFFAPFDPPLRKPSDGSLQLKFQVTADLTMPPLPPEPPDANYGAVISVSVHEYFSHPFDVDVLFVSICYHLKSICVLSNDVPALSFCSKFVEVRTAWKLLAERSKRLDASEFFLELVVGTTMIHVFSVGGYFEHGKRKTTEFISMSTLFDAHQVLNRRPLSRTCYSSLAAGCLQFKLWDPGTNVAFSPSESFVSLIKTSLNKMKWATSLCCIYSEIFADSNLPTILWNDSQSADHNDAREFFIRLADMQVMARYTSSGEGLKVVHRFGHYQLVDSYFPRPYNLETKGEMVPQIQDSVTSSIYFYDPNKGNMCGFTIRGLKFIVLVCCLISFVDRLTCNIFTNPIVLPHAYATPASLVANIVKVGSIQQGMEESTNLQVNDAQEHVGDLWLKCSLLLVNLCAYWAWVSPFVKNKIKERLYSVDVDARSNIVKIQVIPGVVLLIWKENSYIGSLYEAVTYICVTFDSLVQYILERSLLACIRKEDFGGRHLEPNLTYTRELVIGMGLGNLVSIYIDMVSHATALEVTECAKEGSIEIDFYLVSVGSNTYIQNYCVNDLQAVRSITRQQWHPGEHFQMSKALWSLQSKQWDPGKFFCEENFYNLEDKVDFEGVGNDTVMGLGGAASNTILWRLLGLLNSPLQLLGVSFSYALWLIYSL